VSHQIWATPPNSGLFELVLLIADGRWWDALPSSPVVDQRGQLRSQTFAIASHSDVDHDVDLAL
jgi:hypothetical protein